MTSGVGRYVASGMAWDVAASDVLPGFAISTKAMLDGAGVAGFAQLEKISTHRIIIKHTLYRLGLQFTVLSRSRS